jgi:MFS family permease
MLSVRLITMLGACFGICFVRNALVAGIADFLPTSPQGASMSSVLLGAAFAAYPFSTALCSPILPWLMEMLGMRASVATGLCICATTSLLIGLAASWPPSSFGPTLVILRALGGVGAGMAECGCFAAVSGVQELSSRVGLIFASMDVMNGLGAGVGAQLSGALYEAAPAPSDAYGPDDAFAVPCARADQSLRRPAQGVVVGGEHHQLVGTPASLLRVPVGESAMRSRPHMLSCIPLESEAARRLAPVADERLGPLAERGRCGPLRAAAREAHERRDRWLRRHARRDTF